MLHPIRFHSYDILEKANDQVQKITDQRLTGVESRQRSYLHKGTGNFFEVIEMFYIVIVVVATQLYEFGKIHRTT